MTVSSEPWGDHSLWSCERRSVEFTLNLSFCSVLRVRELCMDRPKDQHRFAFIYSADRFMHVTEGFPWTHAGSFAGLPFGSELFRPNMERTGSSTAISPRDASVLEGEITLGSGWEESRNRESGISQMVKTLRNDSEMPHVSRVAPVTSPTSASQRVNLPGVMDAEGRVDESRLRMYIFKNGNITPVMMCPSV